MKNDMEVVFIQPSSYRYNFNVLLHAKCLYPLMINIPQEGSILHEGAISCGGGGGYWGDVICLIYACMFLNSRPQNYTNQLKVLMNHINSVNYSK